MDEPDRRFSRVALYIALAAALLGLIALPSEAAADEPARALLTIADGPVGLLRGAARYDAREGLPLAGDDIVRTSAATRVARIEFGDGRVLDLGPDTQVLLPSESTAAAHGMPAVVALVAHGWAKLAVPASANNEPAPAARLAAAGITVAVPAAGSALMQATVGGELLVFAESRATALWRRGGGLEASLSEGQVWWRAAGAAGGAVSNGAATPALRAAPRTLADALPRRRARFAGSAVEPASGEPLDARDLAPWLRAEPALITALRPRLAALARGDAAPSRPSAGSASARKPAAAGLRTAAARPSATTAAATRAPKVLAGLTQRPTALPAGPAPSIALEPTVLLTTEPTLPTPPLPPPRIVAATPPATPGAATTDSPTLRRR